MADSLYNATVSLQVGGVDVSSIDVHANSPIEKVTLKNGDVVTLGEDGVLKIQDKNISKYGDLTTKEITIATDGDVAATKLKTIDMSAVTFGQNVKATVQTEAKSIIMGSGNDTADLTGYTAKINVGAGDDSVKVGTGAAAVTLGAGKDTVDISGAVGTVSVAASDLNRAEDVVVVSDVTKVALDADGKVASDGEGFVQVTAQNAKFYDVVAQSAAGKVELYTATNNANKVTVAQAENDAVIDVAAANGAANITTNNHNATITLADVAVNDNVDTISVGTGSKAKVTVNAFQTQNNEDGIKSDRLNLTGVSSLKDVVIAGDAASLTLTKTGKFSVELNGVNATANNELNILGAQVLVGKDELTNTATSQYYYATDADATLNLNYAADNTVLDLSDEAKVHNVKDVTINAAAAGTTAYKASGLKIVGSKGDNSIDASNNTVGVYVNGGEGKDYITLGAGADTVEYVAGQGVDSISGFVNAFGEGENKADVLNLSNISSTVFQNAARIEGGKIFDVQSTIDLTNNLNTDGHKHDVIKVQFSDGSVKNIAGDFDVAGDSEFTVTAGDAVDIYAWDGDKGSKLTVLENEGKDITSLVGSKMNAKAITVDASAVTGKVAVQNAAVVSVGTGANHVWAAGKNDNSTITLENAQNTNTDTIWFQNGVDKNVLVENFDADTLATAAVDQVKLVGNISTFEELVNTYTFEQSGADMVVTGKDSGVLTLKDAGVSVVKFVNGSATDYDTSAASAKVMLGAAAETSVFSSAANVYLGMGTLKAAATTDSKTYAIHLGTAENKFANEANFGSYYVADSVKKFDASAATSATYIIAGSSEANNEIIGGTNGKNYLYGGGDTKDTLVGGKDSYDTFYFGKNDGNDTIQNLDKLDTINLYDASLSDYNAGTLSYDAVANTITVGDSKVTVEGGFQEGMTVVLGADKKSYTWNGTGFEAKA